MYNSSATLNLLLINNYAVFLKNKLIKFFAVALATGKHSFVNSTEHALVIF